MVSFGKRIPDMPLYALFLIPLFAVFALRMIAMAPRHAEPRCGRDDLIARKQMIFPPQPAMHPDMTARSTSLIRLSPRTTLGISQFRPSRIFGRARAPWAREAVSHPGWLRSSSSAICVSSALLCPLFVTHRQPSLVAEAFEFFGARFRHAAHAFAGIEPRDGALAPGRNRGNWRRGTGPTAAAPRAIDRAAASYLHPAPLSGKRCSTACPIARSWP